VGRRRGCHPSGLVGTAQEGRVRRMDIRIRLELLRHEKALLIRISGCRHQEVAFIRISEQEKPSWTGSRLPSRLLDGMAKLKGAAAIRVIQQEAGSRQFTNIRAQIFKLKEPKNRFQGINTASLCSLAGQYDNPIPTRFLAPI
jgi:hypothetical protein